MIVKENVYSSCYCFCCFSLYSFSRMFKLLIIILLSCCSFSWVNGEELSLYTFEVSCEVHFAINLHFIALCSACSLIFYLFKWFQLVFSSSATVYGWPKEVPCTEEFPLSAMNPYGRTKVWLGLLQNIICYFPLLFSFKNNSLSPKSPLIRLSLTNFSLY